ncbi:MAG TPA: UbiA-like polyprenyltransferase [Puia sp.]|jgi:4-hydroxybenzoate polyprenyltransferase|nr:UbiA-like polyprenyltransferase [Puia sp.]
MPTVKNYLSLIKFSHTIFAMPFAMIGFFLGMKADPFFAFNYFTSNQPGWHTTLNATDGNSPLNMTDLIIRFSLIILCMIFARSAAMSFNRYLDRNFDAKNPRTAIREIPKGIISAKNALTFTIISCALFLASCFFINKLCFYLSPVALLVVLGYSYTKRFTPLCHLILGIGLSLAPIGAYLAVTGAFALLPILFSLTVIFWVSGFDIIYALQDEEFDRSNELYSMPSWLGKSKALRVSEFLHLLSFGCVTAAGIFGQFGLWYWIGVCFFTGMLIYQHSIVKPNDLSKVNLAFMTANGIASVVFAIFVITDLFVH